MLAWRIISVALSNDWGMFRFEAKPFPEPNGIIPNLILVLIKQDATSFIVPSPPHATIESGLLVNAFWVRMIACFLQFEYSTSNL